MERRFLIKEMTNMADAEWQSHELIPESELKRRLSRIAQFDMINVITDKDIDILLHGEKEQVAAIPEYCPFCGGTKNICKCNNAWDEWVEKSPFGNREFSGTTAENWAAIVKKWLRACPCRKSPPSSESDPR